jgi:muconolactone delta-isomerase
MMWKAIGQSVIGSSHIATGKGCEDAIAYEELNGKNGSTLVCCISDGAGSAAHSGFAAQFAVSKASELIREIVLHEPELTEALIYTVAEGVYHGLEQQAAQQNVPMCEYACTLLGCIITEKTSAFFQVGDGAIIRNDHADGYCTIWWPQNGEYHNTTYFITDDNSFANLHILLTDTPVHEVALLTDGLQMLALNMESTSVHQPFFRDLFTFLRQADTDDKVAVLNRKLAEFLNSDRINLRTDDDKTLFLATRQAV